MSSNTEIDANRIVQDRRYLHRHPEISGFEENTLAWIKDRLDQLRIPYEEVEKGGILGFIYGEAHSAPQEKGQGSKCILLRADMDALEMTENPNNLSRRKAVCSENPMAAHLCGHDAHTAILLETARILKLHIQEISGTVILCFERAEETGGPDGSYGCERLLNYLGEHQIEPDRCIALHVYPDLPSGKIAVCREAAMAGNVGFRMKITGKGGHGSRPDLANHPLDCFMAFYGEMKQFPVWDLKPFETLTFSIPMVQCGKAANIIPDSLVFSGTARAFSKETLERFRENLLENLSNACRAYGCSYEVEQLYLELPLINDRKTADVLREMIRQKIGRDHLVETSPCFASESFAHFTHRYSGAMIFLGIADEEKGTGAPLHSPQFDLDEDALPYGARIFTDYILSETTEFTLCGNSACLE